jgi:uncharacterized protein YuzE
MTSTRYDAQADAAYFRLGESTVFESEEVAPDVILDFDREGRLVGLEVLQAQTRLAPGEWSKALDHIEAAE